MLTCRIHAELQGETGAVSDASLKDPLLHAAKRPPGGVGGGTQERRRGERD